MSAGLVFALACALLAIVYGAWQSTRILKLTEGNERLREIAAAVREGAVAYLWRQYKTIAVVGAVLFLLIGFFLDWASACSELPGISPCSTPTRSRRPISWRSSIRSSAWPSAPR